MTFNLLTHKEKQKRFDEAMLATAFIFGSLSYAKRGKVGCVIAKDNRIIANGYNGTLSGLSNNCEEVCEECNGVGMDCERCNGQGVITSDFTLHAEQNTITYCSKRGIPLDGSTLYLTLSPCKTCAKLIAACGIKRVVYNEDYRDNSGIEYLKKCKVIVSKH